MSDLMTNFFGPLDKGACVYFLIISVLFFISLVILLATEIFYILKNFGKLNFRSVSSGLIILFNIFIAYFVNRLLYTMCNKSLA
jgi:hypothetical protein